MQETALTTRLEQAQEELNQAHQEALLLIEKKSEELKKRNYEAWIQRDESFMILKNKADSLFSLAENYIRFISKTLIFLPEIKNINLKNELTSEIEAQLVIIKSIECEM
jgi:heme oxygenase